LNLKNNDKKIKIEDDFADSTDRPLNATNKEMLNSDEKSSS
jgi:hypothetical protein